jgi:high-affinity iron transporter
MKSVFNFILAGVLVGGLLAPRRARAQADASLQRLASLADYVAADYPGAVRDGRVVTPTEYEEQRGLVAEARALAAAARPLVGHEAAAARLAAAFDRLHGDVEARAGEKEVAGDCRAVERLLLDDFGLVLAPLAPPSEERARQVFATTCAACHGTEGRGDGVRARELKPPPVSFFDGERMRRVSPAHVFNALTFGVSGTAMASFDSLPASDRWSLAFWVVAARHRAADARRGGEQFRTAAPPLAPTASRLAGLTDEQLDELLAPALADGGARAAALAWLRIDASFAREPGGTFAVARRRLAEVARAAGDRPQARALAISAYLEGVEPHEAALRARDRALAERVEHAFFELRRVIDAGGDAESVRREAARATLILDGADEHAPGGASVAFFAALAIALREGFEISLLVAALLAFVRRSGHAAAAPWVHLGWAAAVPAGVGTWFLVGAALGGARRELTEGVLTLVAAAMLLFVSHFVLGRLESRRWLKFLERRTVAEARAANHWPLAATAFVAAYREAIEIVLFFRALALDSPGRAPAIAAGAATGVVVLAALVVAMAQLGRRLDPRPVMLASSVLLTALAVSLVGQGVRALQEGGYLTLTPTRLPSVPSVGLYTTAEGLAVQALVMALVLVPWWLARRRASEAKLA